MSNGEDKVKASARKGLEFVSLFSGCGGFDLGFAQEGFHCVGAVDIDQKALDVHLLNLKGPVFNFDLSTHELPLGLPPEADVVLAGSPCQGFSTLGKRKLDDPRNSLLLAGGLAAIKLNAKVFVAENVLSVKSGEHRKFWDELESLLRANSYKTEEIVIDSRNVGLAQSRRRVFLIAWRTQSEGGISQPNLPTANLRQALDGVSNLPNHFPIWIENGSDESKIAIKIPPGHKLSNVRNGSRSIHTWDIPEVFGEILADDRNVLTNVISLRRTMRIRSSGDADPLDRSFAENRFGADAVSRLIRSGYLKTVDPAGQYIDLTNTFNGKFRRLHWDSHCITVDTRFSNPKYYLHPEDNRGLSVREAARLQGFPDDFRFLDSKHDSTLVGNAVAPPVARHIAQFVKKVLFA